MVSLPCIYRCQIAHEHYTNSARANLDGYHGDWDLIESDLDYCGRHHPADKTGPRRLSQLSNKTVEKLHALGVRHFKIHGKTDDYWRLARHVNYYILNPLGIYMDVNFQNGQTGIAIDEVGRYETLPDTPRGPHERQCTPWEM
jgi:hypothetical protein